MSGSVDCFELAGFPVQVEWGDASLRDRLREALVHRRVPPRSPALTITARRIPAWPEGVRGGLVMQESAEGLRVEEPERGLRHRLDLAAGRAWFECTEPASLPLDERAAPFRLILQCWLRSRGVHVLHAGAVGAPGQGAVLLAAPGGGGKSNTVLSCLTASTLQVLGEDFVAVDGGTPVRTWSLYSSAKLLGADAPRFASLQADSGHGHDPKLMFSLAAGFGARFADGLPLRAILVLQRGAPETRIVAASPGDAVKAMLTSLLMVLPGARRPLFDFTTTLARRLPVYRLELNREPGQIADAIERLLQE